ncbi:MAG: hypothetical protein RIR18_250 [Pseudomonadota bacterium]|jgi:PAS domain S-box-containing protein
MLGSDVISDRLQAVEQQLNQRERDLQSILDHMPSMIGCWDASLHNRFGNHAYHSWFGVDPNKMPGMHIRDVIGEERYRLNLPFIQAVLKGEPQVFERDIPSPDGKLMRHSLAHYIPEIVAGEVKGFYVLVSDVTELKTSEAAVNLAHEHLEQRVAERTQQLSQLTVDATLAEEKERQAIARDLHDDLGQLLHVAKIRLDQLTKKIACKETAEQVQQIDELLAAASERVRFLTAQLSPPVLETLGLVPALAWLGEEMQRVYGLAVVVKDDGLPKPLDTAQTIILYRAARELLINVFKHAKSPFAKVETMNDDGYLMLRVTDEGVGIVDLEAAMAGANGFGLTSVRERINYLDGTMDIEAVPNDGTVVILRLPLVKTANAGSKA